MESKNRQSPLRIHKESHRIAKSSSHFPTVKNRKPVIIHTYTPEIIQIDAHNFMPLVQKLTGSSDTSMSANLFSSSDGYTQHSDTIDYNRSSNFVESPLNKPKADLSSKSGLSREYGYGLEGADQVVYNVCQSQFPNPNPDLSSLSPNIYSQLDHSPCGRGPCTKLENQI